MKQLCNVVEMIAKWLGIALFSIMISVVFYEVVMRYVFNSPTVWTEALARMAMIWLVFLGFARGLRHLDNIRVDFLVGRMNPRMQKVCAVIRYIALISFALVLAYYGWILALDNINQIATGFEIPVMYIYLAVPVSAIMIILFAIELILKKETRPF